MGYRCDNHETAPAALLITILDTGDVASLCGACAPDYIAAMHQAMNTDPDEPVGIPAEVGPDPTAQLASEDTTAPAPGGSACPVCGVVVADLAQVEHWTREHGDIMPGELLADADRDGVQGGGAVPGFSSPVQISAISELGLGRTHQRYAGQGLLCRDCRQGTALNGRIHLYGYG